MYKLNLIISSSLLVFASFFLSALTQVSAESFKTTNSVLEININKDYSVNVKSAVTLENNEKAKVISGYEVVLPVEVSNKKIIKARLGKSSVEVKTVKSTNSISTVEIDFGSNVVKPRTKQVLTVEFSLPNYFNQLDKLRYRSFSSIDANFEKLILTYSKDLSSPSVLIGNKETDFIANRLEVINPKGLLIGFGDSYEVGIDSKFDLENDSKDSIFTTWNLIPDLESEQIINYKLVNNSAYALNSNKHISTLAISQIEPESKSEVGFLANVKKENVEIKKTDVYAAPQFKLSDVVEKEINKVRKLNVSEFQKAAALQDYIVKNFSLKPSLAHEVRSIESYLRSIEPGMEISSLEACLILGKVSESSSSLQIEYGYSLLESTKKESKLPHFWCLISKDKELKLFDPYLDYVTGINYTNLKSRFDRILVGDWVFNDLISSNLGLTSQSEALHPLKLTEKLEIDNEPRVLADYNKTTQFMPSGLFFSIDLSFENFSSKLLELRSIQTNSFKFYGSLGSVHDYSYTLLPKQNTEITLNMFRIENFLNNKKVIDSMQFEFSNNLKSELDVALYFKPPTEVIFAFIIAMNAVGFGIIFLIWNKFLRNAK